MRVLSQRWMQWKWKAWLHSPHATLQSSGFAVAWFAWHSMPARVGRGKLSAQASARERQCGARGRSGAGWRLHAHISIMWLRQIAHVSTCKSHAHSATAFHFFTCQVVGQRGEGGRGI